MELKQNVYYMALDTSTVKEKGFALEELDSDIEPTIHTIKDITLIPTSLAQVLERLKFLGILGKQTEDEGLGDTSDENMTVFNNIIDNKENAELVEKKADRSCWYFAYNKFSDLIEVNKN